MKMNLEEREAFLADVRIGIVAIEREGRGPLAVPIWYGYQPGGEVVLWMYSGSVKERLLRKVERLSFCVQDEDPPYRYVSVEGPFIRDETPNREQALAIVSRYMSSDDATRFVDTNLSDGSIFIHMTPESWLSADEGRD